MSEENDFEHQYQGVLDFFYAKKGLKVERIKGKANRAGDVRIGGKLIEEKGLKFDGMLAYEVIQAAELLPKTKVQGNLAIVPVNAIGNQFTTESKWQVWVCYDDGNPKHIYRVNKRKLDSFYLSKDRFQQYDVKKVVTGYGLTLCTMIPWAHLIEAGVAEIVWSASDDYDVAGEKAFGT